MKRSVQSVHSTGDGDELLVTVRLEPRWFERILGLESYVSEFRGSCTVWNHYPDGTRVSLSWESWLADVWTRDRWKRRDGGELR